MLLPWLSALGVGCASQHTRRLSVLCSASWALSGMAPVDPLVRQRARAWRGAPSLAVSAAHTTPCAAPLGSQAFFSQTGPDGVSVRSHLTEVIHKLLLSKDPDALQKLESLSLEVKAKHFDANQPGSKVRHARCLLGPAALCDC